MEQQEPARQVLRAVAAGLVVEPGIVGMPAHASNGTRFHVSSPGTSISSPSFAATRQRMAAIKGVGPYSVLSS